MKRVCFFGSYRNNYSRNQMMLDGLRSSGVEVIECHESLWRGFDDRVEIARGGWHTISFWFRLIKVYSRLFSRIMQLDFDILYVGFPGYLDIYLAKLIAVVRRKPLVWDVFNSLFLMLTERGIAQKESIFARLIKRLEKLAFRFPDLLFLDNQHFLDWFRDTYKINIDKFRIIPIGGDNHLFFPRSQKPGENSPFRVVYYGTYLPNHGIEFVIEAAHLLSTYPDITFELIGKGPEREKAVSLAKNYLLDQVKFTDWIEWRDLCAYLAPASVILGAFGNSIQLQLTNNNKIYEAMAMAKPVITGRSAALPHVLQDREHCLLCNCGDPQSIADAILDLYRHPDLAASIAANGLKVFEAFFSVEKLGMLCAQTLSELG